MRRFNVDGYHFVIRDPLTIFERLIDWCSGLRLALVAAGHQWRLFVDEVKAAREFERLCGKVDRIMRKPEGRGKR